MDNSQFPVSLLDLTIIGVLFNTQNLVVILALALLEFELSITDFFCDSRFLRVALGNGLEFLDSLFPVSRLAQCLGLCLACLGVTGVKLQCTLAVLDCFLPFLELQNLLDIKAWMEMTAQHTLV